MSAATVRWKPYWGTDEGGGSGVDQRKAGPTYLSTRQVPAADCPAYCLWYRGSSHWKVTLEAPALSSPTSWRPRLSEPKLAFRRCSTTAVAATPPEPFRLCLVSCHTQWSRRAPPLLPHAHTRSHTHPLLSPSSPPFLAFTLPCPLILPLLCPRSPSACHHLFSDPLPTSRLHQSQPSPFSPPPTPHSITVTPSACSWCSGVDP